MGKSGRPIKRGLDYFQLDTSPGDKIKYLKKKCGMSGYGIFVAILERIYKFEGYYCKWDEMAQVLFCDDIKLENLKEIVQCCLEIDLFNQEIFAKYKVLTSAEIQRRYMSIVHLCKRKGISISSELTLISSEEIQNKSKNFSESSHFESQNGEEANPISSEEMPLNSELFRRNGILTPNISEENGINSEGMALNSESTTQRKGKERKGNETKEKNFFLKNSEKEFFDEKTSISENGKITPIAKNGTEEPEKTVILKKK